ncbi:MAG: carboxypeptidase regulatory-like domain-containing protein [Acidobacteria bacterium]|nr:carboxypeptidase regulatory-like domain-containing protein [Acidobacteriota bacterium]
MRKFLASALLLSAVCLFAVAQDNSSPESREELAKLAKAPAEIDGIGRAVVFVSDESGQPVKGAQATLESTWGGDHYCESFGSTDRQGAIALLPIHMGTLRLVVKAKGYQTSKTTVSTGSLSEPIRVTLSRKS